MSARFEIVREALRCGERDAQLLDGRDFNASYWRNARRQLTVIERENFITERERDAYRVFLTEVEQASAAEAGRPSPSNKGLRTSDS